MAALCSSDYSTSTIADHLKLKKPTTTTTTTEQQQQIPSIMQSTRCKSAISSLLLSTFSNNNNNNNNNSNNNNNKKKYKKGSSLLGFGCTAQPEVSVPGVIRSSANWDEIRDDNNNNNNNNNNNKEEEEQDDEEEEEEKYSNSCNSLSSSNDHLVDDSAHFSAHLAIPDDDMQELELWSHFMDDSVPEPSLPCPKSSLDAYFKQTGFAIVNRLEPCTKQGIVSVSRFPTTVPVKKRSKRSRSTRNRSWFTSSHPKSPSSTLSWESTLSFARPVHEMGFCYTYGKPVLKKPRKETSLVDSGIIGSVQRKCSHCQVMKTPQWRAGPNGPKTLCNACGVRFKSGRLFPEYRPACSPTFSSEVHSNSHRKVLEMRHKKEMVDVKAKPHTGST